MQDIANGNPGRSDAASNDVGAPAGGASQGGAGQHGGEGREKERRQAEREREPAEGRELESQPGGEREVAADTGDWKPAERPVKGPVEREPRPDREAGTEGSLGRERERWLGPATGVGGADSPRGGTH
jgi:hypothetical protein